MTEPPFPDDDLGYDAPKSPTQLAEEAVIADIVVAPGRIRDVAGTITPADFENPRYGALYGLIVAMVTSDGPGAVTGPTVMQEVIRRRIEAKAAGKGGTLLPAQAEIAALFGQPWSGPAEAHAGLIREAAISRALAAHGRRLTQAAESGERPSDLAVRAVEEAKAIRDGAVHHRIEARLLADVFADDDPGYDWLIPGLLERADRLVFTGAEGAGKSTFGRQLAACAAAGVNPFTAATYDPCRVLVVDVENSEKQWRRKARSICVAVHQLTGIDPAQAIHLTCRGRLDITKPDGLAAVHSMLDEHSPDLLLIGPLYKLVPRAITNDDDAAPVLAALDSIRERADGPAILMEAHAGHALGRGGERDYRPRGSAALLGWPEFGFGFAPDPEDPARVNVLRWRGDRDERDWPSALRRGGRLPWTNDSIPLDEDPAAGAFLERSQSEWSPSSALDRAS